MDIKTKLGIKYENLLTMEKNGINVPKFIVLTKKDMFNIENVYDMSIIKDKFEEKYLGCNLGMAKYSVRSSGTISTPGRMKTVLNCYSMKDIYEAYLEVVESANSNSLKNYLEIKGENKFEFSIIIQEMASGIGENSCSGVLITKNIFDEKLRYYVEFIRNNTGDKLMSGKVIPEGLKDLIDYNSVGYVNLCNEVTKIQDLYIDTQEIEFVIEGKRAYILQTRNYKNDSRTLTFTSDYINPDLEYLGGGSTVNGIKTQGTITYNKDKDLEGKILITEYTDFEDTKALLDSRGIICLKGGRLSHAAIIATEFQIPCIVGAKLQNIKEGDNVILTEDGKVFKIQ